MGDWAGIAALARSLHKGESLTPDAVETLLCSDGTTLLSD
jgi:hypothetical protein